MQDDTKWISTATAIFRADDVRLLQLVTYDGHRHDLKPRLRLDVGNRGAMIITGSYDEAQQVLFQLREYNLISLDRAVQWYHTIAEAYNVDDVLRVRWVQRLEDL